jgi:HD-GYP domain-containing protein (c-di-GMP phosphodiesterase class II)
VAFQILRENAGTQFDPVVVDVFVKVWRNGGIESTDSEAGETYEDSLRRLADALSGHVQTIDYQTAKRG